MSELTKQQLTVENNSSFPNNNTGFITPTLLRTFNQDMIDSMVDEVTYNADSASWETEITALQQFSASLATDFVSDTEFNAYTQSQTAISASFNSRINAATGSGTGNTGSLLLTASAVSNVITFTKGDGSTFPVTVGSVIDSGSLVTTASFNAYTQSAATNTSASINAATQSLSASVAAINATQLSTASFNTYTASAATNVSGAINAATSSLSASIAVTDLAQSSSIAALQLFSSSLDSTFATDAQLSASASTLQDDINRRLLTSSFQTYTQSIQTQIASIGAALNTKLNTASLSVPQNITGSLIISGSSTGGNLETLRLIGGPNPLTDLALHVLSGSVEITTPQGNGAHFYSNAPITSSNLRINGTAVIKDLFVSGTWGGSGSGSLFVENSITASVISASTIIANSASFQYVQTVFETASIIYSSGSNQLGDELTDVQTLSGSVKVQGGLTVNGTDVLLVGQTASYASASISSSYALSASFAQTASFVTTSSFALSASQASNVVIVSRNGNPSTLAGGTVVRITGANGDNPIFNTASFVDESQSSNTLGVLRSSLASGADGEVVVNGIVYGVNTDPALGYVAGDVIYLSSSGQFTRVQPQAPQNIVVVGEVLRAQQNNGSIYVNISNGWELNELHNVRIVSPAQGDILAYNSASALWENSSSAELGLVNSSSFNSYTSSQTTISSSFNERITALETGSAPAGTVSSSAQIVELGFLQTSSFNTYTQSINNATASYATTSSNTFVGNQIISGNLLVSGANINLEVDAPALSIGTTNIKSIVDSTGSGVVSSLDITRLGAGPTGDLTAIRLQTLSGSDTTGDTLLSRLTTGVNRHTSTAMTGSVVNTQLQAQWATGSAGGRVTYGAAVVATAQSASSTLTLSAGNAAANYGGGTASLLAGRVNIGTTNATITSTGSLTHLGSLVTSQGITVNSGGITATSGAINGDLRVTNNLTASIISASTYISTPKFEVTASSTNLNTAATIRVPDYNTTGSYINNIGQNTDITVAGLLHVMNISSASMATLLSTAATNPNTIYFVI